MGCMEKRGILYGVSVGPGDPGHLTLHAVRTIESCPVIAAPQTESGQTLALDIAAAAVDLTGKTVLRLPFSMDRRETGCCSSHENAAELLEEALSKGQDTAFLTLGDVSVYSTFDRIEPPIRARGFETKRIPGVTSFCAAAARLGISLGSGSVPIRILPNGCSQWDKELTGEGTKILMKSRDLSALKAALGESGCGNRTYLVQNCGMPGERVALGLEELWEDGYFSVVIVKE